MRWLDRFRTTTAEPVPERIPERGRAAAAFSAKLTFDRVERRFQQADALRGVSFSVDPGEILCLLGPSGCGKTTLLRIASGIERPSAGRVLIDDVEVAGPERFVPPEKRNVGLMFQDFALFPHLTILDNVAFGLKRLARDEARREARAVLSRVGLQRYADNYPSTLSGGEQQRVALARAIAPRPSVVLMDEPFSGLDVQLREAMQEETLRLLHETRATCMMVTHSPDEAMRLGDRIAVMAAGRLLQIGRAKELYHDPANLFVARLFSAINEIALRVEGNVIRTPIGSFAVPGIEDGDMVTFCIRRTGLRIAGIGPGLEHFMPVLDGRIVTVRFQGDIAHVSIAVQGFERPLVARAREHEAPAVGADVKVSIDPASVLIFRVDELQQQTAMLRSTTGTTPEPQDR